MLAVLMLAEGVGCSLALSAVAWLRYLSGLRLSQRKEVARFVLPIATAMWLVAFIIFIRDEQQRGQYHPESSPDVAGLVLFFGVVFAGMLVWGVVEFRRYRARPHGTRRGRRIDNGDDDDDGGDMARAREGQHTAR